MSTNKVILLPTDFSKNARHAINYALNMYADEGCEFVLMHSIEVPINTMDPITTNIGSLTEASDASLKELAAEIEPIAAEGNSTVSTEIEVGTGTATMVENAAYKVNAGMVIMGTKGASGIREMLMGSVTQAVMHKVDIPVLAVPEGVTWKKPDHIIFASDLQEIEKKGVLNSVMHLASKYDSKITILYAAKEGVLVDVDEAMEGYNLHTEFKDMPHEYNFIESENPNEGIEQYLQEHDGDLLVTISRHNKFWERLFHKSVTGTLAMHTNIPMLALHDA